MKTCYKIFKLKKEIKRLKRKRKDVLIDISYNHKDIARKVDNLEHVMPNVFKEIDRKIERNRRLINILNIRDNT